MKSFTGRRKRSQPQKTRLQGHRKRRKTLEVKEKDGPLKIDWTEYKTIRQYPTTADVLEELRTNGYVKESGEPYEDTAKNGHTWITED